MEDESTVLPPLGHTHRERKAFKDALMVAFHRLGGIEYLVEFGRTHPTEFVRTCARMIPLEVKAQVSPVLEIIHALPATPLDHGYTPASADATVHEEVVNGVRYRHQLSTLSVAEVEPPAERYDSDVDDDYPEADAPPLRLA